MIVRLMFDVADAQFSYFMPLEWSEKIAEYRNELIEEGDVSEELAIQLEDYDIIEMYHGEEVFFDTFFAERFTEYMMYFDQENLEIQLFKLAEWDDVLQDLANEDADMDQIFYSPVTF